MLQRHSPPGAGQARMGPLVPVECSTGTARGGGWAGGGRQWMAVRSGTVRGDIYGRGGPGGKCRRPMPRGRAGSECAIVVVGKGQ